MKKSTKGAVAASAAVLLLLGGWGTHASWTDNKTVTGTDVGTGTLALNGTCDGWLLKIDTSDPSPVSFDPSVLKLGPGNILTRHCTFTIDTGGAKVTADFSTSGGGLTGADAATLASNLNISTDYTDSAGVAIPGSTTFADGDEINADITVTLPAGVDSTVQNLAATLQDITVTATAGS